METNLKLIPIPTSNSIKLLKHIDEATIRQPNTYYAKYGNEYSVEILAWSVDLILNTHKNSLRDKVREGLVGVLDLESGRPLALKKRWTQPWM